MDPAWAQVFVGLLQCGLIAWGLWQMQEGSARRDRQMNVQLQAIEELLKRSQPGESMGSS